MKTALLTVGILLLFAGCKKEDYRDKYVGEYEFVVKTTHWDNVTQSHYSEVDTVSGSVSYYDKRRYREKININHGTMQDIIVINEDGKMHFEACDAEEVGSFISTDSINYTYTYGSNKCDGVWSSSGRTFEIAGHKKWRDYRS